MPDWARIARRGLGKAARVTGNGALTRPAFVASYGLVANLASRFLIDVPHAEAVYLTGSLLSPRSVAPGVSDIDLLVIARLPTCETELEFRATLSKRWRRLSVLAPVLYNLEYLDAGDVPFLSAFGNSWAVGLSGGFRLLRGTPLPHEEFERPFAERQCERLAHALGKWRKTGCHLLDSRLDVEPWVLARAAERLLALAAAHRLGVNRYQPLDELLAKNSMSQEPAPGSRGDQGRAYVRQCLTTTLEVLERFTGECIAGWDGVWRTEAANPDLEPSPQCWQEADTLRSHGFESVYVVPYGPSAHTHRVVAVGGAGESSESVVLRAERSFLDLRPASVGNRFPERPLILTRRLWDAAALFEPSPFTGAHLASGRCPVFGDSLPSPLAPPPEALSGILRARTTDLFHKPRARLLRVEKSSAAERLSSDLRLAPALSLALDTNVIHLGLAHATRLPGIQDPEPVVIEALRGWIADRHEALRPALDRRRTSRIG